MKLREIGPSLGVMFAILILDFASKWYVNAYFVFMRGSYPYGGIPLFYDVFGVDGAIVHATNTGAAWGVLEEHPQLLLIGRIILVILIFLYLLFGNRPRASTLPLTLIIAGAIGNLIDTFLYGHVIDMFLLVFWGYHYPVFNVADSSIFIGVITLFFCSRHSSSTPIKNAN